MPKMKGKVLGKVSELILTLEQHEKLLEYTTGQGGSQNICQRVYDSVMERDGKLVAQVYDVDMQKIQIELDRKGTGGWQNLFREIMAANK
jgi:hypothetical protein